MEVARVGRNRRAFTRRWTSSVMPWSVRSQPGNRRLLALPGLIPRCRRAKIHRMGTVAECSTKITGRGPMTIGRWLAAVAVMGLGTAACVTVALAPGAEKVKITKNASDVASCKPVGNVKSLLDGDEAINATLQNQTLGLGGNTVFVTGAAGQSVAGVAYSCP
jgi:hypothetical protein